jgi:hypothetical protein
MVAIFSLGVKDYFKKKRGSGQPGGPYKCAITIEQSIWPVKVKGKHFKKAYSSGGVAYSLHWMEMSCQPCASDAVLLEKEPLKTIE